MPDRIGERIEDRIRRHPRHARESVDHAGCVLPLDLEPSAPTHALDGHFAGSEPLVKRFPLTLTHQLFTGLGCLRGPATAAGRVSQGSPNEKPWPRTGDQPTSSPSSSATA